MSDAHVEGRGETVPESPVPVVALAGSMGYVGGYVLRAMESAGCEVVRLPRLAAIETSFGERPEAAAERWFHDRPSDAEWLLEALGGVSVLVNAAGMATPTARRSSSMWESNAVLPMVFAQAADVAGVRRLVHVSSAAVQGSQSVLDESLQTQARTPYAASKAAAEAALVEHARMTALDVVIYRPTSVQGGGRSSLPAIKKMLRLGAWPVVGSGNAPLPLLEVVQVADFVRRLVFVEPTPPRIVTHPWSGVTQRSLAVELLGRTPRFLSIPSTLVTTMSALLGRTGMVAPELAARWRRLELLVAGQAVEAPYGEELLADVAVNHRPYPGRA